MVTNLVTDIRRYGKLFVFPLMLITVIVMTFLSAMHAPTPHEVPIAIVGPAAMVEPLTEGLRSSLGDRYTISTLPDVERAREAVASHDVAAALVLTATAEDRSIGQAYWNAPTLPRDQQERAAVIYIASAASPALARGAISPLQSVAVQMDMPVMVRDVVPLADTDQAGNGQMWFTLAVTIAAYVGVTMLWSVGRDLLNLEKLLIALLGFGLFMGILSSLLLAFVFDSLNPAKLPLLLVTAVLNVTAVGLGAAAICRLAGVFATPIVMFVFVGLGTASSGAAIPVQFVPSFFRFFGPIMPYGATSHAVRSIVYFDNANLWHYWVVLATWIVVMGVLNAILNRWKALPTSNGTTVVAEIEGHAPTSVAAAT